MSDARSVRSVGPVVLRPSEDVQNMLDRALASCQDKEKRARSYRYVAGEFIEKEWVILRGNKE